MLAIISFIVSFVVICTIVWLILKPVPLKVLAQYFYPNNNYAPNGNAIVSSRYTLYSSSTSGHKNLIVVFIGGALLTSNVENSYGMCNYLNEQLGYDYDILTFNYPVRFKNTLHQTMLSINGILSDFLHYENVHALGISFGALLAGAFYQKESTQSISKHMQVPQIGMEFKSFAAVSGLFETTFNTRLLTKLFSFYTLHATPSPINYNCYGLQIPKLILNARSDFLIAQTVKFIRTEVCTSHIYESTTLPHPFVQYLNLPEARDAIIRISKFITQIRKWVLMSMQFFLLSQ